MSKTVFQKFDPLKDYTKELKSDEIKTEDGRDFVLFKGLSRLGRERGILSVFCIRLEELSTGGMYCTMQYTFEDGRIYQGSADATIKNCNRGFGNYLTAIAETRSAARCLRTAFGISMCSVEEKADIVVESQDTGKIGDHQVVLIKHIAKEKNLTQKEALKLIEGGGSIEKLTKTQAFSLIEALNKKKVF